MQIQHELVKEQAAAEFLKLGLQTLRNDRNTRRLGIPYLKIGRSIRYSLNDLEKFLSDCRRGNNG